VFVGNVLDVPHEQPFVDSPKPMDDNEEGSASSTVGDDIPEAVLNCVTEPNTDGTITFHQMAKIGFQVTWLTDHKRFCEEDHSPLLYQYLNSGFCDVPVHPHIFEDTYANMVSKIESFPFETPYFAHDMPETTMEQLKQHFRQFPHPDIANSSFTPVKENAYRKKLRYIKGRNTVKQLPPGKIINFGVTEEGVINDRSYLHLPTHPDEYLLDPALGPLPSLVSMLMSSIMKYSTCSVNRRHLRVRGTVLTYPKPSL
jgi:hypothetical protein